MAFDVTGRGPELLLLHGGFIQSRRDWHVAHVDRLSKEFTVITVDLRGHGESDWPTHAEEYAPERMIDDLAAVADACRVSEYLLWGYSLGGTIALQAAARSPRIRAAIAVGVWFGRLFTESAVTAVISRAEAVSEARTQGTLAALAMPPSEREFFTRVNLPVLKAYYVALLNYPAIEPVDLLCPMLMVAGTDNAPAASNLSEDEPRIRDVGSQVRLFEGLDHEQEFSAVDVVLPDCVAFLRSI